MKLRLIASALAFLALCAGNSFALAPRDDDFSKAMELYENGMFERAGTLFGNVYARTGDVDAKGYETLCSVRLQEAGHAKAAAEFAERHSYSVVVPQIHFYEALNLFDAERYQEALREFLMTNPKEIYASQIPEYLFKVAYSKFGIGDMDGAAVEFEKVEKLPQSDFTAPSLYALGYINYTKKNFDEAFEWFVKSGKDPRFTEQSDYYKTECRFMRKDYAYVIENGPKFLENAPKERVSHLSRMISESCLATGDNENAKKYYDLTSKSGSDMDRNDYFYAGSLFYATGDYAGAIDNFSMMTNRTDSIGQIANYELGYSYIQKGNKVAAMEAFRDASELAFNAEIQEDARFNYAKLSFDLNHNPSVFDEYMAKYGKAKGDMIYSYMALSCLYNHDYAGAVEAYSNIDLLDADQKANYMKANYLRANQLIKNGSWSDAVPLLKAASYYSDRHDPFHQLSRYWLGESYFRSDQFAAAAETFKELHNISALQNKKEGRLLTYDIAYSYFKANDYDNASRWFDQYLSERNPEMGPDAALRRADCDFVRKDYQKAVKGYEAAVKRFSYSDDLYPFLQTGIAYGLAGDKNKKINALSVVLDASTSARHYPETMYELGRAYVDAGKVDDAVACFNKLRSYSDDKTITAKTLIELGMIARNRSEDTKALGYYKQVVSEMPGTEYAQDALLAIESIYQTQGRADEYLDYAETVGLTSGKSDSEKDDMYFAAAEQVFMTENYEKAQQSLGNYIERYPQGKHSAKASYYMAECLRNEGKKEQACDWYGKALGIEPDAAFADMALLRQATLKFEMERFGEAYSHYAALERRTKDASLSHSARMGLTRSAYRAQDYSSAVSQAAKLKAEKVTTAAEATEADYISAKSYLSMNEREKAFELFRGLSVSPKTAYGAEASYMLILDAYDQGQYESVESMVYKFANAAPSQSYWLAKAFITLGDSFAERDELTQAKATFESVRDGYKPSGDSDDVLDNVRIRLSKLNELTK